MSKESMFFIYCIERYRYFKGLTGADATKIFDQYNIYSYVLKYLKLCILWVTVILYRILMIISVVFHAIQIIIQKKIVIMK